MITTLYFIQFIAFYLWQITAPKRQPIGGLWTLTMENKSQTRLVGVVLMLVACEGFVIQWGLASGLIGAVVGLMAVGCLSVIIEPFKYLRPSAVAVLYVFCVFLEILL